MRCGPAVRGQPLGSGVAALVGIVTQVSLRFRLPSEGEAPALLADSIRALEL